MDSYERVVRALNFEIPDRVPYCGSSFMNRKLIYDLAGEGPPEEILPKAHLRLGIDIAWQGMSLGPSPEEQKEAWGSQPSPKFKTLEELTDKGLDVSPKDKIVENYVSQYFEYKKAWEKYGLVTITGAGTLFNDITVLLGWNLFARAVYQARDALRKIMDKIIEGQIAIAEACEYEWSPIFCYGDDLGHKAGLMISPFFLREEWVPRIKRVIAPLKRKGIKVLLHSHGNVNEFIQDFIDMGFDGLHPIEPTSGMDLGQVKEKYGDRLVLVGNIDVCYLLRYGSTVEVSRETKKCIEQAAPGSGYCLSTSGQLSGATTENVITMSKTLIRYGTYPKLENLKVT